MDGMHWDTKDEEWYDQPLFENHSLPISFNAPKAVGENRHTLGLNFAMNVKDANPQIP